MAYNKYYLQKRQVSYDNGLTWEDVTPIETRQGAYIDSYETLAECEFIPYEQQYLTFVAEADYMSVMLESDAGNTFQYSTDSGATWSNLTDGDNTTAVNSGQTIMFKASGLTVDSNDGIGTLIVYSYASVQGNIMSLVYGDNFVGQDTIPNQYQFRELFSADFIDNITSAENLVLPATTLTRSCYYGMFRNCITLTTAPELPAITLANYCYSYMFEGCESLTVAPELPATTLANNCYSNMFGYCTGLTTAPELTATTLANGCYKGMFNGCTSLVNAPELPATTLADYCYQEMFNDCTSLNYIKCLATDISASGCTDYWVNGVAVSGTFVKDASMSSWTTGVNGIPSGWTVQNNT